MIASTDHLGATARRTLDGQEKPVGTMLRSDLAALDLPWPRSLASLRPARLKPKKPHPYQRRAVRDILQGLETHERGQVVMACGTGKTLVARFLHDAMASKRTLVLVPSLSLLKQSLREWLAVGTFDYLAVCSDDTVTPDDADAVVSATSELGVPVTTDPKEITRFLRQRGGGVVFATYQSSPRIAAAQMRRVPAFDLVIADEAHRCAGPEAGVFATVLDPKKIKARKRLFITATPRYFTDRLQREAREADWDVASMDDEQKFGPVLHRLSFAQAIEQDLLSDYQVVVVGVTDRRYREMAERGAFVTTDGQTITDARTLARQIGLLRAMRNHDLHRVVSFHSRIDSASRFATSVLDVAEWLPDELRPSGGIWADHVSGKMTSGERETRLNRLRALGDDERGILTNARCLSEGVDVPTLDGVAFIDTRRSQVDIVQAVGRSIRKAPDKKVGTIVIPVFVDEDADPEQALESSEFDRVWRIVRALRGHDDDLAEELDQLRREQGRRGSVGSRPGKIVLDLPTAVNAHFARAFNTKVVEASTVSWEFMFGLLLAYREEKGDTNVGPRAIFRGSKLGLWAVHQGVLQRDGRLLSDREAWLRCCGFDFARRDSRIDRDLDAIRVHLATHGHLPRTSGKTANERRIANNIRLWRQQREQGKLPDRLRGDLESIRGFYWTVFEESLAAVASFIRETGRRPRDRAADPYESRLAGRLRAIEKRPLTESEAGLLGEALGGTNKPETRRDHWFRTAARLERFVDKTHRLPKQGLSAGDTEEALLATWINTQRTRQAKSRSLDRSQVTRLESITGWYWKLDLDGKFLEDAERVQAFQQRHGRLPKRNSRDPEEARLARWCSSRKLEVKQAGGRPPLSRWRLERLLRIEGLL